MSYFGTVKSIYNVAFQEINDTDRNALVRLTYTSIADKKISKQDLNNMIEICQYKNGKLDVTGVLVFTGDTFIQILEGKLQNIDSVMRSILKDNRHNSIEIQSMSHIKHRVFSKWSMGFVRSIDNKIGNLKIASNYDEIIATMNSDTEFEDKLIKACLSFLK